MAQAIIKLSNIKNEFHNMYNTAGILGPISQS